MAEQGLYASSSDGKPGLQLCEADKGIIAELFEYTANAQKVSAFQVFEEKYREKINETVSRTAGEHIDPRKLIGCRRSVKSKLFEALALTELRDLQLEAKKRTEENIREFNDHLDERNIFR